MSNIRLKINQKELVKHIELKFDYWINRKETNCYAFALGFDIPERNIMNGAYKVGVIGFTKEGIDLSKINIYSYEERLIKDLKTLKLIYEETSPEEIVKDDYKYTFFLISLLEHPKDFHFLRKSKQDNTWWHKRGWEAMPNNIDDFDNIIVNPKNAVIGNYEYIKTYKIGFKRK